MTDCNDASTCSICLESIDESVSAQYQCRLRCGHSYHPACIMNWFQRQTTCPTCRREHRSSVDTDATTSFEPLPAPLVMSSMLWARTLDDDDVSTVRRIVLGRRSSVVEHPVLVRSFRPSQVTPRDAVDHNPRRLVDHLSSLTPTSTHRFSVDDTPAPPLVPLPTSLASSSHAMRQRTSILSDLLGFGTRSRVAASLARERL